MSPIKRLASKCADGDIRAALRLLASDYNIAPFNWAALKILRAKHHPAPQNSQFSEPGPGVTPQLLFVDSDIVLKVVKSLQSSGSPGLDGMRPIYLKQMFGSDTVENCRRLLSPLTTFVNFLLRGTFLENARDTFLGLSIFACTKKSGRIRPVSVGCTVGRFAARTCEKYTRGLLQALSPLRVGTSSGCEAVLHAARQYVFSPEHISLHDVHVLIKVDVRNAFNELNHPAFLEKFQLRCPESSLSSQESPLISSRKYIF